MAAPYLALRLRTVLVDGRAVLAEPAVLHDLAGHDRRMAQRGCVVLPSTIATVDPLTLEAVLTTEQHLPNLTGAHRRGRRTAPGQVKMIEGLLDAVSRSRLEAGQPAQTGAAASRMAIWLLARETVRATKPVAPLDVPLPPKKRAASLTDPLHTTRV